VTSWDVVVTGAVGIAGIAGTMWQGKKSRESQSKDLKLSIDAAADNLRLNVKAEDERARVNEKRRIYARFVASLDNLEKAAFDYRESLFSPDGQRPKTEDYLKASQALTNALAELMLIAPENVGTLARNSAMYFWDLVANKSDIAKYPARLSELAAEYGKLADRLYDVMRADLGEKTSFPYRTAPDPKFLHH
jgi:hypothetical protein